MAVRVGINGFGRIGRCAFRSAFERERAIEWVGINDLADTATLAHLLASRHRLRPVPGRDRGRTGALVVDGVRDSGLPRGAPRRLPWAELGVDVVLECTGKFRARGEAAEHIDAGAGKVIISAPGKSVDATIVLGVNFDTYDAAALTTSSRTLRARRTAWRRSRSVLHEAFGIRHGTMTTVHAYTGDQRLVDLPHKDLRRARAAGANIVPTSTGAANAIGLVIPELAGRLAGLRRPRSRAHRLDGGADRRGRAADDRSRGERGCSRSAADSPSWPASCSTPRSRSSRAT